MGINKLRHGFTIVELLIVIVVISILAAITIVAYNGITAQAYDVAAQDGARSASQSVESYSIMSGAYPATLVAAGIPTSGGTTFEYSVNNSSSPKSYCVTATVGTRSYRVSSTAQTPVKGICSGHTGNATQYPADVTAGLISQWKFNGNANDSKGSSNGTVSGAVLAADQNGNANRAYSFDGVDDYIEITTPPLTTFTALSLSAWVKPSGVSYSSVGYILLRSATRNSGTSVYSLSSVTNGVAYLNYNGSVGDAGIYSITSVEAPTINAWEHLVLTWSGGNLSFYVNDALVGTRSGVVQTNATTGTRETIGSTVLDPSYRPFRGSIDDVRIYNRALTQQEVSDLYTRGAQ